jgi:hypothetical protein
MGSAPWDAIPSGVGMVPLDARSKPSSPLHDAESAAVHLNTLVKLLRVNKTHRGYTYHNGMNVCPEPYCSKRGKGGGFYLCRLSHCIEWTTMYPDMAWVAVATVPPNTAWTEYSNGVVKAHSIVLSEPRPLDDVWAYFRNTSSGIPLPSLRAVWRYMAGQGRLDRLSALLRLAPVPLTPSELRPMLCAAAERGHTSMVGALLALGAVADADVLARAVAERQPEVATLLMHAGACPCSYTRCLAASLGLSELIRENDNRVLQIQQHHGGVVLDGSRR